MTSYDVGKADRNPQTPNSGIPERLYSVKYTRQTFGDKLPASGLEKGPVCHPERSEGSREPAAEILRCAQDDSQDIPHVRSREALSPNV